MPGMPSRQPPKITLVLVESQRLIRDALRALLESTNHIEVVGEASGADDLTESLGAQRPDVALLSIDGSDEREFALFEQLPRLAEDTRPIVITSQNDANLHARAIERGAMGIVLTVHPAQILVKAVRRVHAGELWLDRTQAADLVGRLTRRTHEQDNDSAKIAALTARERQIVTLVTEGLTNKNLADRLGISEATARNHLTSILDKLKLTNRFQLAVYAFRKGLVPCPAFPAQLRDDAAAADPYIRAATFREVARRRSALTG
jgi:DNA-binding NarL/FixJ family response regulator